MWCLRNGFLLEQEFPYCAITTTKASGNMRDPAVRARFAQSQAIDPASIVTAEQVHGKRVALVSADHRGKSLPQTDGLITADRSLALAVFTADCLPVFFAAANAVGVVHAGWRGLAEGIIPEAIALFQKEFHIEPEMLLAAIGPHIRSCCFTVNQDVKDRFGIINDRKTIDLSEIAVKQLRQSGISHISIAEQCTAHNNYLLFSYRRDKTIDRLMSIIMMRGLNGY
jgi:YfiH family protein